MGKVAKPSSHPLTGGDRNEFDSMLVIDTNAGNNDCKRIVPRMQSAVAGPHPFLWLCSACIGLRIVSNIRDRTQTSVSISGTVCSMQIYIQ